MPNPIDSLVVAHTAYGRGLIVGACVVGTVLFAAVLYALMLRAELRRIRPTRPVKLTLWG